MLGSAIVYFKNWQDLKHRQVCVIVPRKQDDCNPNTDVTYGA